MDRNHYLNEIEQAFRTSSVVAILGPRQCGKTTLARQYFTKQKGKPEQYFDLENPTDLLRLEDPMLALEDLKDLIVIDEIQHTPDLFKMLRVLVDDPEQQYRFLILGSASRDLIHQSSESLAGRIHYIELPPFSFIETHELKKLWIRGGFPKSYLANNIEDSVNWRKDYIRTFLEQDIPNLGIRIPAKNLRRFWMMLAHYHGQLLNTAELGNALDLSHHTIRRYLDILTGTFMMRQLPPWYENVRKRQVKSTKIYFRDSGIYHTLLDINTRENLLVNPKIGASWEGFALESVIRALDVNSESCYFWATHSKAELDLLIVKDAKRLGFEFKYTNPPKVTKSMKIAYEDLHLNRLTIIYPGDKSFLLTKQIECKGLEGFLNESIQ